MSASSSAKSDWFPSDHDAIRAAREEVKNMFRSPDQLGRIGPYLVEWNRKKQAVETQLSSAVRTQVDETRLGLQLLTEASQMMSTMRQNFLDIDQYCKDCKMVLRDNPEIQRVNTARKNLDATTRLLDKFRSLPVQAEALIDELDSDDRSIKNVYKGLRKLFLLRDSAMVGGAGGGAGGANSGFSADFQSQLQENFAELSKSADEIEERIWENIADCTFLAKDDPVILVRTLEVIEMEDRAMRKVFGTHAKREELPQPTASPTAGKDGKSKKSDLQKQSSSLGSSGDFLGQPTHITMREKCLHTLEKSIADEFQPLHIDEEQSREQERKDAQERKKKELAKEEKRKAALKASGKGEEKKENPWDEDVDEPEELPSPVKGKSGPGGKAGGLFHSPEDAELDDLDAADPLDPSKPSDYILTILESMTSLVETLPQILQTLIPCFPPDYHLDKFYIERYLRWLKLTISFHTNDGCNKLSKRSQLKCINWIEWFRHEVIKWEMKWKGCRTPIIDHTSNLSEEKQLQSFQKKLLAENKYYDDLINELLKSYTSSTEETLMKLCDNILDSDILAEAERNSEGHYVTSGPPDLFYTINSTIEIVLQSFGLNTKPLTYVCRMLSKIFDHYQQRCRTFLGDVSRGEKEEDDQLFFGPQGDLHKSDTYFAAVINNSTICQEYMDDLKEKILDRLREAEQLDQQLPQSSASGAAAGGASGAATASSSSSPASPTMLASIASASAVPQKSLVEQMEDLFEECGEGFVSVASDGIDLLVLQISITLQKPMANLFSPQWLAKEDTTNDIVLTLQDFLEDYQKWINREAYFSRLLLKCLHNVIAEYLRMLTMVKPSVSTQLFERLKQDKQILQQFFMQFTGQSNAGNNDDEDGAPSSSTRTGPGLLPLQILKNELRLLTLVNKVVHEDPDFMAVHFDRLIARFGASSKEVMEGLISMRTDLSKSQRQEVMNKFSEKLPRANQAELLEKQLIAQNTAAMSAMASPKAKSKRGKNDEEEGSIRSMWERFKSRDKGKSDKKQPKKSGKDEDNLQDFLSS